MVHFYTPDIYVGGHTLGFAHCSSFQNRIHNFNTQTNVDPSLQASFAANLRKVCPMHNKVNAAGATLDSTTTTFDNVYYKSLLQGTSIFSSDQASFSQRGLSLDDLVALSGKNCVIKTAQKESKI